MSWRLRLKEATAALGVPLSIGTGGGVRISPLRRIRIALSLLVSIWTSSLRSYGGRMPPARAICGPISHYAVY